MKENCSHKFDNGFHHHSELHINNAPLPQILITLYTNSDKTVQVVAGNNKHHNNHAHPHGNLKTTASSKCQDPHPQVLPSFNSSHETDFKFNDAAINQKGLCDILFVPTNMEYLIPC